MKSIAYVVPYFGKMRKDFNLWLYTCKYNPTIDWIILTDDHSIYPYPPNVKVVYTTFEALKSRIQSIFNFEIVLDKPYKLCDYKVAYGEIFMKELKDYDFWGYCDMDVIWGDIRHFITNEILESYEKIGFQGHSTLYKNTPEVNSRYKRKLNGEEVYKKYFTTKENNFFDENVMTNIYQEYNIPFYHEITFANISPLAYNFYLRYFPNNDDYKNKHQIFVWKNGKLFRMYAYDGKVFREEFMYVHFLRRKMKNLINNTDSLDQFVIIPNKFIEVQKIINYRYIVNHSKNNMMLYYINLIINKWNKISIRNIYLYFKERIKAKKKIKYDNNSLV